MCQNIQKSGEKLNTPGLPKHLVSSGEMKHPNIHTSSGKNTHLGSEKIELYSKHPNIQTSGEKLDTLG